MWKYYVNLYPILGLLGAYAGKLSPFCNSSIYCGGELLKTIQLSKIFPDSKSFVDLRLLKSEKDTLAGFNELCASSDKNLTNDELMNFLDQYFEEKQELYYWNPPDLPPNPSFLHKIRNNKLKQYAKAILNIWPLLGRKVASDVAYNSQLYSFIYVPKGFIVPGSSYKELYYWDSYWIIRGLIISNMLKTAKGMIENFLFLVKRYGYVPSGSRIYYLGRSHPPLLTWMVYDYFMATGNKKWLKNVIPVIERELQYWLEKKIIILKSKGAEYKLLRYLADSNVEGPRPEYYYEDYTSSQLVPESMREIFFTEIKSASESGWDFSSRWVSRSTGDNQFYPTDISISRIIPVDLNSIFAGALQRLGNLRRKLELSGLKWFKMAKQWRQAIDKLLWDPKDGVWYDYDTVALSRRKNFYLSCATPLWAGAVEKYHSSNRAKRFIKYLHSNEVLKFRGGVPASLWASGEQWDYPNAWPPLQSILIGALQNSQSSHGKKLAKKLAKVWVNANYKGFKRTQKMFVRYSCVNVGEHGTEEESESQNGFGWTNGVLLELIQKYGDILFSRNSES